VNVLREDGIVLKGKTALVTGSTSGIGLGIARALAEQGANIVLNGFGDAAEIAALQAEMVSRCGVQVAYHAADMAQAAEIEAMVAFAADRFGAVDILVNNAGIQHVAAIEDFPVDKWDAILAINLSSVFHTTRLVLPVMRERNWGRIVNIASTHGLVASVHKAAYVAAKHGVVGFTKVTALETARTGITCNAICPGWTLTPLVQRQIDARALRDGISADKAKLLTVAEKHPSGEFATIGQLAALAVFLCSPAADQVRGAAWNVDGGWIAQ
jgi:3-hydroxybutyrate dehydrogenase